MVPDVDGGCAYARSVYISLNKICLCLFWRLPLEFHRWPGEVVLHAEGLRDEAENRHLLVAIRSEFLSSLRVHTLVLEKPIWCFRLYPRALHTFYLKATSRIIITENPIIIDIVTKSMCA